MRKECSANLSLAETVQPFAEVAHSLALSHQRAAHRKISINRLRKRKRVEGLAFCINRIIADPHPCALGNRPNYVQTRRHHRKMLSRRYSYRNEFVIRSNALIEKLKETMLGGLYRSDVSWQVLKKFSPDQYAADRTTTNTPVLNLRGCSDRVRASQRPTHAGRR